ncbi:MULTISPECIES: cobalamin biosynthesis protein [Nocardiaceae]|jgi:adenosylcobinamide-phosphate synthase|uniref:cobalamin biosynthesis protein n=1 Tax=Nocardiaceae TaxID=85025 RepID=UPI00056B8C37|nr:MULTISPECIES: cobalamin biosynthesis protein [Rhodococcus]OZE95789.1 cobalamin biosynthesis protein [Rhodococcus sp. 15-1189-1-1a]OZF10265.1 cobalamin biosynthesis protein [Rhodococcus sp. 14-2686-1-2]
MTFRWTRWDSRAAGLVLGFGIDLALADPRRYHPVAGFGSAAAALERHTYRDARAAGAVHTSLLLGAVVAAGSVATRAAARRGVVADIALTAMATWTALGGTSLARTGSVMSEHLRHDRIDQARALLPSLCGRDPRVLDSDGLTRASVESVAENTSDATVAVVFWGAVAGVPGILGYRAVNTLDAMIGYRSPRYQRFGWFAARLDDVINLVPARVTGVMTAVLAPLVGGRSADAVRAWRLDAARHPSPNAGVAEATAAGALGISVGGRTEYTHGVEIRPTLGDGRRPLPADLQRAARLSTLVQIGATAASAALAVAIGQAGILRGVRR